MKLCRKMIPALVLAVAMLFSGAMAEESPVGLWYMDTVQDGEATIDALANGVYIMVELYENGRASTRSLDGGKAGDEMVGLWKEENGQILVTIDEMTIRAHMENGKLVFTEDDGVVEHMSPVDRDAVSNLTGRWTLVHGEAEDGVYTSDREEALLLREDWTAQYWEYDEAGLPNEILYGNWQAAADGRVFVTIENVTAVGTVENRQMALAYEDRVLILSAPDSYREERGESAAQDADVSGEWQLRTVVIAGNEYDAPELGMDARFILEEGGTARSTAVASDGSMDEEATGSWSYVNQTVTITLGGESVSGEYRNGKIVLQYTDESVWTLERLGGERQAAEEQTAEEEAPDILGVWLLEGAVVRGEYITAEERSIEANIVLMEDGSASGETVVKGRSEGTAAGSWRWVGSQLGITLEGEEVLCSLENGKLVAHYGAGQDMVFGR